MRLLPLTLALLTLAACGSDSDSAENPDAASEAAETAIVNAPTAYAPLNLNTASEAAFQTIPGVGERMAHEFDEYRPYASITQFRRQIGKYVDADVVAGYEDYVFVPIDVNESDAATVAQLPGIGEAEAQTLIASRPYPSEQAFLDALVGLTTEDERLGAAVYLGP